ncbi:MAG TPA: adenylate/guanylate cyclase domain-containing protein [Acidimicrobiia bacterium]|nr:adenylate/guanylate cyclase domain-containing protein [Acidimicrobiia bacterium]
MSDVPETRFAWLGEDRIAYQVLGEGPVDHVIFHSVGDPIDLHWDWPPFANFLRSLASFSRLIMFDRRGSGSSDPASGETLSSWEAWAEDARAVLDEVGSERAVIHGGMDSGVAAILFAATHPDRTQGLILSGTTARFRRDTDYPWGLSQADSDRGIGILEAMWGTEDLAEFGMPDAARDPGYRRFFARQQRLSVNRRDAGAYYRWMWSTDVREVLPSLRVPTLVVFREGFERFSPEHGRYLAEHIPGARFVLVPGADGALWSEPTAETLQHIEEFLLGLGGAAEPDRALAAILFTDVVGSTERAAAVGDREWRNLIESHDVVVRTIVAQHQGRLIRTTGDGMLATFDGPGRAIRCATALRDALRPLGLEIRAGLHTGEIELTGADIAGIGVHIAARVVDHAAPGQLLTSAAVPMLVAGSGIEFEDCGERDLKGVPGTWRLFGVLD